MVMSSIYITSTLENKKNSFLYILLIVFAQIILNLEILSLINTIFIVPIPFLVLNLITFVVTRNNWNRKGKPAISWGLKEEAQKIFKALKSDKLLSILSIFFILFIKLRLPRPFRRYIRARTNLPLRPQDDAKSPHS